MKIHIYKVALLFIILFIYCNQLFAQTFSEREIQKINLRSLRLLQNYTNKSVVITQEDYYKMLKYFESENCYISNDILPNNKLNDTISLFEYSRLMSNTFAQKRFLQQNIKPIELSQIYSSDGNGGYLFIYANKYIDCTTKHGTRYIDTIEYKYKIVFNEVDGDYTINSITLNEEKGSYLILNVRKKNLFYKSSLTNQYLCSPKGEILLNDTGTVFLKDLHEDIILSSYDRDIYKPVIVKINDNSNHADKNVRDVVFKESQSRFKIILNSSILLNPPLKMQTSLDDVSINMAKQYDYSFDFLYGLIIKRFKNSDLSLQLGLGFESILFETNLVDYNLVYHNRIDFDNYNYTRINNIFLIKESDNISIAKSHIGLEYRYYLRNKFSLGISAGISYNKHIVNNYNASINGEIAGLYYDLFNVLINDSGIYDFGDYTDEYQGVIPIMDSYITEYINLYTYYHLSKRYSVFINYNYCFSKNISTSPLEVNNFDLGQYYSILSLYNNTKYQNHLLGFGVSMKF